jgi:hypothetical protein
MILFHANIYHWPVIYPDDKLSIFTAIKIFTVLIALFSFYPLFRFDLIKTQK